MSLDTARLEAVRPLAGGGLQARCPACAEQGADTAGEHLRVQPDGRFGCCVHPKDRDHRKRIFALAGAVGSRKFTVRIAVTKETTATSVAGALRGTLGTGSANSVANGGREEDQPSLSFGTLGTPSSMLRTHRRESIHTHMCKDIETSVPSVPEVGGRKNAEEPAPIAEPLPYLSPSGLLVIPFASNPRFHWWKEGQDPDVTRAEVLERMKNAENENKENDDAGI